MASRRSQLAFCIAMLCLVFAGIAPQSADAQEKIGIFFHGLCNSAGSCAAAEGRHALNSVTGSGFEIKSPFLSSGCYGGTTPISETLGQVRGKDATLIAYSAGSCALNQLVDAIARGNRQDLARVKVLVSLEASPNAFGAAVRKVQEVNPSVVVRYYRGADFGTDHAGIPGSARMATEMLRLMGASPSSVVVDVPPGSRDLTTGDRRLSSLFTPTPGSNNNTGLFGPLSSGLSPLTSLLSSFSPQTSAPSSPYAPAPLSSLAQFNPAPSTPQATTPTSISSGLTTSGGIGITSGSQLSSQSQTQPQTVTNANTNTNTNVNIQQNTASTFAPDTAAVTYSSSTASSQASSSPTFDLRATLANIMLKVRDILQTLLNYMLGQR